MKVNEFTENLRLGGYWRERCDICREVFDACEGEDVCKKCQKENWVDKYGNDLYQTKKDK